MLYESEIVWKKEYKNDFDKSVAKRIVRSKNL